MNYALIEDGIVTNIIWLYPANADEFPNAVPLDDVPAGIGDSYDGEVFYRDGERILSYAEREIEETEDMRSALALLGVAAGDAEAESAETQPEAADSGAEVESAEAQPDASDKKEVTV